MAGKQARMSLLSRYEKLYREKYGAKPDHNLNKEQWAADMLIESYDLPKCYDLLQYYFDVAQNPNWKYFANYADEILRSRKRTQQDEDERAERRNLAKEWLNG
jgi:hypothetical protein